MFYILMTHGEGKIETGFLDVGDIYEIVHWNDMDVISYWYPTDRLDVVKSGLLWDDRE